MTRTATRANVACQSSSLAFESVSFLSLQLEVTPPPSRGPPAPRACTAASPRAGQSTGSAGALVSAHQRLADRPPKPSRSGHTPQLTPLSPLAAQAWRRETRGAPGEPTLAPSSASRLGVASPRSSPRSPFSMRSRFLQAKTIQRPVCCTRCAAFGRSKAERALLLSEMSVCIWDDPSAYGDPGACEVRLHSPRARTSG